MENLNKENETKPCTIQNVSARYLSGMTTEELKEELAFVDDCNPSNSKQLNTLIDYAAKIKAELNVR
tara:strand:+ start:27203 stop:27403 length:201 start_codon:yes stop_codon:yes gene_type:complete